MDIKKPVTPIGKTSEEIKKSGSQMITQREAVFQEVSKILKQEKITSQPKQPAKAVLKDNHMKAIVVAITNGFKSGAIDLKKSESNSKKLSDAKLMESYVVGLINNWLRRDSRLNGTLQDPLKK
ncbi:MAG: hypothetical protein NTV34_02335 [Proteobacteria bacterium]|nr:hypothetical protein [Pseudomonadota bacterium]